MNNAQFDKQAGAERVMQKHGFTLGRLEATRRFRMAMTEAELYASKETINTHWTDNEPNDSPRMAALRKARSENPLMQQAIKASTIPRNQDDDTAQK